MERIDPVSYHKIFPLRTFNILNIYNNVALYKCSHVPINSTADITSYI